MTAWLKTLDPAPCTFTMVSGYRALCEVADSKGHMILGRKQAWFMEYVSFREIQEPAIQAKTDTSIKAVREEPAKSTNGPVIPRVQECTD